MDDASAPLSDALHDEAGRQAIEKVRAALGADFEVLRCVGRGSVATVYLAKDRALGVLFAIKVLNPGKAADETARRRFEREARAAASLADHPNTVPVTRFGRLPDETPYLVMQYVKGRTMEERLKAEGKLSVPEATQILREVASALALAHGKGIVHRDVRPANILWDEEKSRARLTDFGIAAVISPSGTETTRLTKTGQLLGDPTHLSPEQLLDEGVSELADMYLFGILGYELLAGKGPYDARTPTEWITAHLNKQPRDLRDLRPDAPAELADLLRRCLAKQPKHRPSAKDVVRALEGGGPTAPAPSGAAGGTDLAELVKRRVPHIVLFTVGGGVTLIGLSDAVDEYFPEGFKLLVIIFVVAAVVAAPVIAWFHGERGSQRAPAIEYVLLALIAVTWLVISALVVM
ncbi:MAG: serine/threonine-protein kinase [Longimicrobiales bacterium]|nr:serine/threonine-protein kinase [Longimicrobiales bacterium]